MSDRLDGGQRSARIRPATSVRESGRAGEKESGLRPREAVAPAHSLAPSRLAHSDPFVARHGPLALRARNKKELRFAVGSRVRVIYTWLYGGGSALLERREKWRNAPTLGHLIDTSCWASQRRWIRGRKNPSFSRLSSGVLVDVVPHTDRAAAASAPNVIH